MADREAAVEATTHVRQGHMQSLRTRYGSGSLGRLSEVRVDVAVDSGAAYGGGDNGAGHKWKVSQVLTKSPHCLRKRSQKCSCVAPSCWSTKVENKDKSDVCT